MLLTEEMQVQAIADRLAGNLYPYPDQLFTFPWSIIWKELKVAADGTEQDILEQILGKSPDGKLCLAKILSVPPCLGNPFQSLEDLAKDLPPLEWVWENWIPRGLLTVIGSCQGTGKSFVVTDFAYRIIHNMSFPDGAPITRPGANVIYVDAEVVPQILNKRALDYQLDRSKVFVMLPDKDDFQVDFKIQKYQEKLSNMVAALTPELVIIDSLSAVHSGAQNAVEDVRPIMFFLNRIAKDGNCGLIIVHHVRKPAGGMQRMATKEVGVEDYMGASFITQAARVVIGINVIQTDQEFRKNGPRAMYIVKTNLGQEDLRLGYEIKEDESSCVKIHWSTSAPTSFREPTRFDGCREWLERFLCNEPNGVRVNRVIEAGKEQGYSPSVIYRARDSMPNVINTLGHKSPKNAWKLSMASDEEQMTLDEME